MSRRLALDFISSSPLGGAQARGLGLVILAISLVIASFAWERYESLRLANEALARRLSALHAPPVKIVRSTTATTSMAISPQAKQALEQTIEALSMPWEPLLQAIERADMGDIALLGLDPDSQKQEVVITGEAKNLYAVLDYVQRLLAQGVLTEVVLQKHSVAEDNPDKPVSFTIVAHWRITVL